MLAQTYSWAGGAQIAAFQLEMTWGFPYAPAHSRVQPVAVVPQEAARDAGNNDADGVLRDHATVADNAVDQKLQLIVRPVLRAHTQTLFLVDSYDCCDSPVLVQMHQNGLWRALFVLVSKWKTLRYARTTATCTIEVLM